MSTSVSSSRRRRREERRRLEEQFRISQKKTKLNFQSFLRAGTFNKKLVPSDAGVAGHIGRRARNAFKGIRGPEPHQQPKTTEIERGEGRIGLQESMHQAKDARKGLEQLVAPHRLSLVRTLGWGGNGIASLFSYTAANGETDHFVAKHNIDNSQYLDAQLLKEEERRQRTYRGARHVVRERDPPPIPGRSSTARAYLNKDDEGRRLEHVMFLEFLPRGSLQQVIAAAQRKNRRFPNRVLWHIFHCLVKACVALEYPPSVAAGGGTGDVSESIPLAAANFDWHADLEGPTPGGTGLVHFDMDPENILVGHTSTGSRGDRDKHPLIPVMKVGDLGVASTVDASFLNNKFEMWNSRSMGKNYIFTPEQFSEEWDWVDGCPNTHFPAPKTAGKYSWKTNLYQAAQSMICAITLHYPALPPFPKKLKIPNPRGGPGDQIEVWSYGAYILSSASEKMQCKRVDKKLRELVARCLCDRPVHRPGLPELLEIIEGQLARDDWEGENTNGAVRRWVREVIDAPPAGPLPVQWVDLP